MVPDTRGIWLLLGLLWLLTLPLRPLFDPDEGRYAEIPREMVASGDWVTPRLNSVKYFEKPPLQYWATAALYSVFGVSEWSSRLWAAVVGFLCMPMTFVFAMKSGQSRGVAVVAAAILAVSPFFVIVGQVNLLDQAFSSLLVAAVFAFVLAQRAADATTLRRWMLVTWGCLALAVLSKGIVAPVLAGATLALYMLWTRSLAPMRRLHLLTGVPLFALIVVPWFVLVQRRNPEFAQFFFLHEHLARYLTTVHERVEPWWYFIGLLLVAVSPVVGSLGRCRQVLRDAAAASTEFQTEKFLLTWCAVVLVFFSLSGSKLAPYMLPIMAPLALLVAPGVAAHPRALRRAALTLFVSLCIIALSLLAYTWRRNGVVEWFAVAWTSAAVAGGFAAWRFARRHCLPLPDASRWLGLAAASIFGYQGLIMAYSSLPPKRSAKLLASEVIPLINENQTLYSVGQFRHTLVFYLGRTVEVFAYRGELDFGLLQAGATANSTDLPAFRRRWDLESNALAFVDPNVYAKLAATGLPGRIVARDRRSVVVSRR